MGRSALERPETLPFFIFWNCSPAAICVSPSKLQKYPASPPATLASAGKLFAVAVIGVVALLVIYTFYATAYEPGCVTSSTPTSFTVNGKTYGFTYVARCEPQREAGLMNKKVTNETTMLFAFPFPKAWSFWMQSTNTSLDMIWINATGSAGRVVYLALGTMPYSTSVITPASSANYVIEAKAGFASENGIKVGSTLLFG